MGKIWIEVCLISARGLQRKSAFWKLQWFAVGWIDPDSKYCTKIDISGDGNPVWKIKFLMAVDASESKFQELSLNVEVYSREPVFLRSSLLGTATIVLKEFLDKYNTDSEVSKPVEEVGSFQLRKKKSSKPQGFVDISIRISEEREEPGTSHPDVNEGYNLTDHSGGRINFATRNGDEGFSLTDHSVGRIKVAARNRSVHSLTQNLHPTTSHQPESSNLMSIPSIYSQIPSVSGSNYPSGGGLSYQLARTPPPPPPPVNAGYVPNFFPRTDNLLPSNYINMLSSVGPPQGRESGVGFGMGVGAGALAAGAVIFGDDFMSGFDVPSTLLDFNYG